MLAGSTVTNTGATIVSGNLGVSPGTAVTGFPPGIVIGGGVHAGDTVSANAQLDLISAYNNAAGRPNPVAVSFDIGAQLLGPGVYRSTTPLGITGTVTLDGRNDPNSVFIFQLSSTLTAAINSRVALINGANACNVFWQVGSSATLLSGSIFDGTILAGASITVGSGVSVSGRMLAITGAVTLDSDTLTDTGP